MWYIAPSKTRFLTPFSGARNAYCGIPHLILSALSMAIRSFFMPYHNSFLCPFFSLLNLTFQHIDTLQQSGGQPHALSFVRFKMKLTKPPLFNGGFVFIL